MPLPPAVTSAFPQQRGGAWDDWEEGYTREEQRSEEQNNNVRLWQQANTFQPTYSILSTTAGTSSTAGSSSSRVPPAAALNSVTANGPPVLKILKRPNPAPGSQTPTRTSSNEGRQRAEKSLAEREREYLEARRRIYGEDPSGPTAPSSSTTSSADSLVLRDGMARMSITPAAKQRSSASVSPSAAAASGRSASRGSSSSTNTSGGGGGGNPPRRATPRAAANSSCERPSGVSRQPKGPNAQSGGFGFGATAAQEPSSRSSSRGSRRQ